MNYSFTTDPAWPWSIPGIGLFGLLAVAALLTVLTIWTYLGNARAGRRRITIMIAFRLAAWLLACASLVRPSLASRENLRLPSTLVVLLDYSESMGIVDESNNQSRWEALRRTLRRCEPVLKELHDEQNVTVQLLRFAGEVDDYTPDGQASGKRTDIPNALHDTFQRFSSQQNLRGLVVVSDGADNGTKYPLAAEVDKWRGISCPIYTFGVGRTDTTSKQNDIMLTSITPQPAPVPVKGQLTVVGVIDAPGFEGKRVPVRLLIDGKEVAVRQELLSRTTGNEVRLTTTAPDTPGEIMVTLKVDPQFGEVVPEENNHISTFLTVAKEGLSVLYVEGKFRAWEPKFIRAALDDPRMRVTYIVRPTGDPYSQDEAPYFDFSKQHYDVIILGDIAPRRLSGGNDQVLKDIRDQVARGTGLMMIGGYESFGAEWHNTPLADVLPVQLDADGQDARMVQMVPTAEGLDRYVMRLTDKPAENEAAWARLPKLGRDGGVSRMGHAKPGAVVLARANDAKSGPALLVSHEYRQGRTLAFAADTTYHWRKLGLPSKEPQKAEGVALHTRFWKQAILWLAKQDESAGSVWVKPDTRRLGAGGKLGFSVGARGKNGEELKDVRFEVQVTDPQKATSATERPVHNAAEGFRGTFWKTEAPGEYHMVVRAYVKENGKERKMDDEARIRFLVYQDTTELARQAADHAYLTKLASSGGGKAYRLEELPRFLQDLKSQPLPKSRRPKTELWPDWRRAQTSAFLPTFLLLFVGLVCGEWALRRYWGLV